MNRPLRSARLLIGAVLAAASTLATAQWVFLARKAIGRVEQMQSSAPAPGGAAYDVATVIVEVAPDKVFDVVKRRLSQNTEVRVTRTDDTRRSIEFTDGSRIGGIQVNALGDNLSQLLVSTAHPGTTSPTPTLVQRILDVCRDLGVSCERSGS